jgi:hypothetical protein
MAPLGLGIVLLLAAAVTGSLVRAYLLAGGFWFPGRWRVTRAKDPITFWFVVVAYAVVAAMTGLAGLLAVVGALLGHHQVSD